MSRGAVSRGALVLLVLALALAGVAPTGASAAGDRRVRHVTMTFVDRSRPTEDPTGAFHEGPIVDVLGLGSHDVLDIIKGPGWNPARMAEVLDEKNVRVLGIFSEHPYRPLGWKQVGAVVPRRTARARSDRSRARVLGAARR